MPSLLSTLTALSSLLLFTLSPVVDAHATLAKPRARWNGMDKEGTMGCPPSEDTSAEVYEYKAGETIDVRYHRNNHIGGFIRWSLVRKGESHSKENFDDHAFFYTCRESGVGCVPRRDPHALLSGDGTNQPNTLQCGDEITLPDWLDEGEYTLQWTWFGVGHHNGDAGVAENQFRSCADIKLTTKGDKSKPKCPKFVGGDRMTKAKGKSSDQCLYFHINDIITNEEPFASADKSSDEEYKYGIPAAIEKCNGGERSAPDTVATSTSFNETAHVTAAAYESGVQGTSAQNSKSYTF